VNDEPFRQDAIGYLTMISSGARWRNAAQGLAVNNKGVWQVQVRKVGLNPEPNQDILDLKPPDLAT
jgi:hypothetical protein